MSEQQSRYERIAMPKKRLYTEQAPQPVDPYSLKIKAIASVRAGKQSGHV
jgi:hypothetical protein